VAWAHFAWLGVTILLLAVISLTFLFGLGTAPPGKATGR
jgi:hypothetical protein